MTTKSFSCLALNYTKEVILNVIIPSALLQAFDKTGFCLHQQVWGGMRYLRAACGLFFLTLSKTDTRQNNSPDYLYCKLKEKEKVCDLNYSQYHCQNPRYRIWINTFWLTRLEIQVHYYTSCRVVIFQATQIHLHRHSLIDTFSLVDTINSSF